MCTWRSSFRAWHERPSFACDCVDPELACNYRFPTLGLELWREMAYHPKLLDNPEFQAHMRVLPENLEYEQTHGWTFQAVWVRSSASMAALPLEPCRAPYDGGPYHPTPNPGSLRRSVWQRWQKNTDWSLGKARRRRERMTDIKSMNLTEMAAYFKELGEPVFRAKQVFQWLHRGVSSFDEMTNLSKPLREKLAASCILYAPRWSAGRSPPWTAPSSTCGG